MSTPTIFISYRREDASAGRLYDWLRRAFKDATIFADTDKAALGDRFPEVLQDRLDKTDLMLAITGRAWASITDAAGNRRLFDPADFVALELARALDQGIRVIPVLVGGASPPHADQLPAALIRLSRINSIMIDDRRFAQDSDNLVELIRGGWLSESA